MYWYIQATVTTNENRVNIREFTVNDTEAVIAIWRECELVVGWNDPHKDIERKLKVNPELFLVAELDKRIVGSVMGGYEGHRGWINYLAVSPDVQKKGLCKALDAGNRAAFASNRLPQNQSAGTLNEPKRYRFLSTYRVRARANGQLWQATHSG